jgi:hypothetical protein
MGASQEPAKPQAAAAGRASGPSRLRRNLHEPQRLGSRRRATPIWGRRDGCRVRGLHGQGRPVLVAVAGQQQRDRRRLQRGLHLQERQRTQQLVELGRSVGAVEAQHLGPSRRSASRQTRSRRPSDASRAAAAASAVVRSLTSDSGASSGTSASNSTRNSMSHFLPLHLLTGWSPPPATSYTAPMTAVFAVRWTARRATSAGPRSERRALQSSKDATVTRAAIIRVG